MSEIKVRNLKQNQDGRWLWQFEGINAWYYTAIDGAGVWFSGPRGIFQIKGTADFQAPATASGLRRKLVRLLEAELNGEGGLGWGFTHYV